VVNPGPPLSDTRVQSDPPPDVEQVKVELVVMTEREEAEETAIGQSEASNEKSAVGECPVTGEAV